MIVNLLFSIYTGEFYYKYNKYKTTIKWIDKIIFTLFIHNI